MNIRSKSKRLGSLILTLLLLVLFLYIPVLATDEITVSTVDELKAAISNAPADGSETTIIVTGAITCQTTSDISPAAGTNITIAGSEGGSLTISKAKAIYNANGGTLTLKDISVISSTAGGIYVGNGITNLENVEFSSSKINGIYVLGTAASDVCELHIKGTTTISFSSEGMNGCNINFATTGSTKGLSKVYIEGGTIDSTGGTAVALAGNYYNTYSYLYVNPKADITLTGGLINSLNNTQHLGVTIEKQDGYDITSVKVDGINQSSDSSGNFNINAVEDGLIVKVASGGSANPTTIPAGDIEKPNDVDMTVEGSYDGSNATINVACDTACVVVGVKDGVYSRLTYDGTSGHTFTTDAYEDGMTFIVAVKGDVSGDGEISAADFGALVAAFLGTGSLDALNSLVGDVSGDGDISAADFGALVAAYLGTGTIPWLNN